MNFPATFTDQMGHKITLNAQPKRIISLVPSQTEFLARLGLDDEVVGITKFCVHPESWFRKKIRVGGTKQYDFAKIASLQPDLIIGNKEENDETQIKALQKVFPIWMSDIHHLDDAIQMMRTIGMMTGKLREANSIENTIYGNFGRLRSAIENSPSRKVAYLIWRNPYMAAGRETFIDAMLKTLNLDNVVRTSRYPEVTLTDLAEFQPEWILLSSEPYPFAEKHFAEIQARIPKAKIFLVDGEMFSWYGSRLIHAPAYFEQFLHQAMNV